MTGLTIQPSRTQPAAGGMSAHGPRFGTAAEARAMKAAVAMGQEAVAKIAHEGAADRLFQFFSKKMFGKDVRVGGMSLEDVAARLQTLVGIYILQGYLAIKEDKHPWETNGRNAVVWLMTTYLVNFLKSDTFGINTLLLNPFMKPKADYGKPLPPMPPLPVKEEVQRKGLKKLTHALMAPLRQLAGLMEPVTNRIGKVLDRAVNPFRMTTNYVDIIERAGVKVSPDERLWALHGKKALWSNSWLDLNKANRINNLADELSAIVKEKGIEALSEKDREIYKAMPGFLRRINVFPLVSTALITAATVYLIGSVAMKIVYKFIAPLDKDFDPSSVPGSKKKQSALPMAPAAPRMISVAQPRMFASFASAIHPRQGGQA